jgi:8-oxo-dGTP diphosphatase
VTTEKKFLASYRPDRYPRPAVTVDIVVFTLLDATVNVLLVKRGEHPFKGRWALPGGFVRVTDDPHAQGEDLDAAAVRELAEETGLAGQRVPIEQIGAFGRAGRDPRMRVISVAYSALVRPTLAPLVRAGGDATHAGWHPVGAALDLPLAFDHADILSAALERLRAEAPRAARALVPETFSMTELRSVNEAIVGAPMDRGNFRKRFLRMIEDGEIAAAPGKRVTASRPARVYRFTSAGNSLTGRAP